MTRILKKHNKLLSKAISVLVLAGCFGSSSAVADAPINHFILDNTASSSEWGLIANIDVHTDFDGDEDCEKETAIFEDKSCGATRSRDYLQLQVIQNYSEDGKSAKLTNMVGLDNAASVSSSRVGTSDELNWFPENDHLIQIDKYRTAANKIAGLIPESVDVAPFSFGTISFEQFIDNISKSIPMYGIVRVKIPLKKNESGSYELCGKSGCPLYCGPSKNSKIKNMSLICGKELDDTAKIVVFGSLFMDLIDVASGNPIPPADMPANLGEISFSLSVPVLINPAPSLYDHNVDAPHIVTGLIKLDDIEEIKNVVPNNVCGGTWDACNFEVTNDVPYNKISDESKARYEYKFGKELIDEEFYSLPKDQQFNLLMPSGYEQGWKLAFDKLDIKAEKWSSPSKESGLGLRSPIASGAFTLKDIRDERFEDIPALIYSGGIASLAGFINISGLVYAGNVLTMEQAVANTRQYISGGIIVRDSFYVEFGDDPRMSVISNNPDTYTRVELNRKSLLSGKFKRFKNKSHPELLAILKGGGDLSSYTGDITSLTAVPSVYDEVLNSSNNPGPQWTEIKPQ